MLSHPRNKKACATPKKLPYLKLAYGGLHRLKRTGFFGWRPLALACAQQTTGRVKQASRRFWRSALPSLSTRNGRSLLPAAAASAFYQSSGSARLACSLATGLQVAWQICLLRCRTYAYYPLLQRPLPAGSTAMQPLANYSHGNIRILIFFCMCNDMLAMNSGG